VSTGRSALLRAMIVFVMVAYGLGYSETTRPVRSLPPCSGVTLSASYLASAGADHGPGFRFTLVNKTAHEIRLAEPVPSSSHWYARARGRWWWRASNGAGGSLADAGNERGRVIVYSAPAGQPKLLILPAHKSTTWDESQRQNPVLAYTPGCKLCSYEGEREYQVIFAYAYLSAGSDALLSCGLRSLPVPMPPKF
jgi:hypothetical protein